MRTRNLSTLALMVAATCTVGQAAHGAPVQLAQLESIQRQGPGATVPPPQPRAVEPPLARGPVDPSGVWFYIRRHDLGRARSEFARLQAEHPGWRAPDDLMAAMEGTSRAAATSVRADPYQRRLNALAAKITPEGPAPKEFDEIARAVEQRKDTAGAERLGRALLNANALEPARTWFDRALAWAKPNTPQQDAAVQGLIAVETGLGQWDAAAGHIAALSGDIRANAMRTLSDAAAAGAERAAKAGDWATAERLAALAESNGVSRVRTDLGWAALDAGDATRAAASFAAGPQTEESRYGRILALSHDGQDAALLASACDPVDRSSRATEACGDAFAARVLAAYEHKEWRGAIAADETAETIGVRRSGPHLLAGWSFFRLRDYPTALRIFESVAAVEPDAVDGIAQTLLASGRIEELQLRAFGSPRLAAVYRQQMGSLALIRQRSLLAASLEAPGTEGIAAPSATVGLFVRDKTGAPGADHSTWRGLAVSADQVYGADKFSLGIETGRLNAGAAPVGAQIGSARPASVLTPHAATLASPWASWEREALDRKYTATIGTTPIGGAVGALPAAAFTAERDGDTLIVNAAARVAPRYDSLLAMAGLRDGATGARWGRVVEYGPQVGAIVLLNQQFSISGSTSLTGLSGKGVIGNTHFAGALSLTYEIKTPGFDYLRVGPSYGFDHYRRNENFFTLGNGGYYSPNAGHSLGAFADFLTSQGRTWLLGGRVTVAWQHSNESTAVRFPLADDGTRFPGQTQSQIGTDSVLRGAVLATPHLILGVFGRVSYAPSGRDTAAGVTLTIPFGARTALFASDLPHFADRSWP